MTIGASNRNDAVGNGTVSVYPYTFKVFAETDLVVTVRDLDDIETVLTLATHYTVSGVGQAAGGNVTLVGANLWQDAGGDLLTGWAISIRRVVPLLQETDFRNQGGFFADVHEATFDYMMMALQQLQDAIDRSILLPPTFTGFDMELPIPQPGAALGWNAAGDGLENLATSALPVTAFITTLLDDVDQAEAQATLGIDVIIAALAALDASAIPYDGGTGMSATDVEAAIDELATEKENTGVLHGIPLRSSSVNTTSVLSDANSGLLHPTADNNPRTFTIDSNANVAYDIGTTLTFVNEINVLTIAITSDTLVLAGLGTTGSRTLAAMGLATAYKKTATSWIINGTGLA